MNKREKFDCPRCHREYELALDLEAVRHKQQRARCTRCGERFELAPRVEAHKAKKPTGKYKRTSKPKAKGQKRVIKKPSKSKKQNPDLVEKSSAKAKPKKPVESSAPVEPAKSADITLELADAPIFNSDWLDYAGADASILGQDLKLREEDLMDLLKQSAN